MRCPICGSEEGTAGCTTLWKHPRPVPVDGPGSHAWDHAEMVAQRRRAERAEAEVARLRVYEPRIKRLDFREGDDGGWEADIATRATPEFREHFAVSLAQIMVGANAPNYVEMSVVDPSDNRRFIVTIQRAEGKTPAQFRAEAEKERDTARAELLSARKALRPFAAEGVSVPPHVHDGEEVDVPVTYGDVRRARAALGEGR